MKKICFLLSFIVISAVIFQGCRSLNPSVMMKTGKDFKYNDFPTTPPTTYAISVNDELSFNIYSNDGFKLVDVTNVAPTVAPLTTPITTKYKVEFDGTVKLPLLGHTLLKGMTVREAEVFLEEKYSTFYNKPFVRLEVTNRRVIIFPGAAGAARVITLVNENTTLIEALAQSGGIPTTGKAYKVKLLRGDLKNPQVFLVDLSTLEGVKKANLILQANDIIYIESKLWITENVIQRTLTYASLLTSTIVLIEFFKTLKP